MAFLKTAINPTTGEEVTAYWRVEVCNIAKAAKRAHIEALAYIDAVASEAAKSNDAIRPIGYAVFDITAAEVFNTYFDIAILDETNKNQFAQAYAYIKTQEGYTEVVDQV